MQPRRKHRDVEYQYSECVYVGRTKNKVPSARRCLPSRRAGIINTVLHQLYKTHARNGEENGPYTQNREDTKLCRACARY